MRDCSSGYCGRPAVAAVYPRIGGAVLIRVDHLDVDDRAADWRCADCLHDDIDRALGLTPAPVAVAGSVGVVTQHT